MMKVVLVILASVVLCSGSQLDDYGQNQPISQYDDNNGHEPYSGPIATGFQNFNLGTFEGGDDYDDQDPHGRRDNDYNGGGFGGEQQHRGHISSGGFEDGGFEGNNGGRRGDDGRSIQFPHQDPHQDFQGGDIHQENRYRF